MIKLTIAGLASVALLIAGAPPASATVAPPDPQAVSPSTLTRYPATLAPDGGDRKWIVYDQTDRGSHGSYDSVGTELIARDRAGDAHPIRLYADESGQQVQVAGDIMTIPGLDHRSGLIDVWNLATDQHQAVPLPTGATYMGTSPDGFIYYDGPQQYDESMSGTITDLGNAFPHFDPTGDLAITDYVVADQKQALFANVEGQFAAYSFATKTFRTIKVAGKITSSDDLNFCDAILGSHAVCDLNDVGSVGNRQLVISLTTDHAVVVRTPTHSYETALSSDGVSWAHNNLLHTASFTGRRLAGHSPAAGGTLATALSATVVATHGGADLDATAGAGQPLHHLLSAPDSPVETARFALGGGRIAWVTDTDPAGRQLHVAKIDAGVVSHARAPSVQPAAGDLLGVSKSTLAYPIHRHGRYGLLIRSSDLSTFVPRVNYPEVAVSGHLVIYGQKRHDLSSKVHVFVYDTKTGTTTGLGTAETPDGRRTIFAATGSVVAISRYGGAVNLRNLSTGVSRHIGTRCDNNPSVYAAAGYVGWQCGFGGSHYVDATKPTARIQNCVGVLRGVSARGLIVGRRKPFEPVTSYLLVGFGSGVGPTILSPAAGAPMIVGDTVAWRTVTDQLVAADSSGLA